MRHLVVLSALLAAPAYAQGGISGADMDSIRAAAAECGAVVTADRRADTVVMTIHARTQSVRGPLPDRAICARRIPTTSTARPYALATDASDRMLTRIYDWMSAVPGTPVILETRTGSTVIYRRFFPAGRSRRADVQALRASLRGT